MRCQATEDGKDRGTGEAMRHPQEAVAIQRWLTDAMKKTGLVWPDSLILQEK